MVTKQAILNTLGQNGDKFKNSEFYNPRLISLKVDDDGDCVGRMSLTIVHPDGRSDVPLEFDICIDLKIGEDPEDWHWSLRADDMPQIAVGGAFVVGDELEDRAAYELNQVFCLGEALGGFDSFIENINDRLVALGKINE